MKLCLCVQMTGLVQRCVIIQRDENGFGLTVSGDNPVFVQLVKEGKAHTHIHTQKTLKTLCLYALVRTQVDIMCALALNLILTLA